MAAILQQQKDGEKMLNVYKCGGSLITPNVVLTGVIVKLLRDFVYFHIFIYSCSLRFQ
jgi:hypothetical protein